MKNIELSGSKNIRDLGGIKVKDGIIKNNKLIRGDLLNNLTKEDIEKLVAKHKLSTIIDLRADIEVKKQKDIDIPDVKYINIPIFNDNILGVTLKPKSIKDISKTEIDMKQIYIKMLSKDCLNNISEVIKFIMRLRDNEYSVLFHCTQGKDRTGVITAILLMILGVDKKIIIDDYLYTNQCKADNNENPFLAKKEYIEEFFGIVDHEWNGRNSFIENGLKIKKEDMIRFKEKVIES